jgi:hypothetical protein
MRNIELLLDQPEPIYSETFEIKAWQRAWIPTLIDGEIHQVQYGICTHSNHAEYPIVTDVWIDQLDGAPEFELTEEMKKTLSRVIMSANQK